MMFRKIMISAILSLAVLGNCISAQSSPACSMQETESECHVYIKQYDLEVCYKQDPDRPEIYGVVEVHQTVDDFMFTAYLDCSIGVVADCGETINGDDYERNTIIVNGRPVYYFGDRFDGVDVSLCIPEKLYYVNYNNNKTLILEMHNFSYTTVGGGYAYLFIKYDAENNIKEPGVMTWDKERITHRLGFEDTGR